MVRAEFRRALALRREIRRAVLQPTSRSPISLMAFPTLALSTLSTASTDGRWPCSTSTPPHASSPSCSRVSDKRLPTRSTPLSTPPPGCTIIGPIWTSNCGGHTCVTAPPYLLVTSRSFIRAAPLHVLEGGWTTTASVDYGSM